VNVNIPTNGAEIGGAFGGENLVEHLVEKKQLVVDEKQGVIPGSST
jgi:hypothetical protein